MEFIKQELDNLETEKELLEKGKNLLLDICEKFKDNEEHMQQGMEGEKAHALDTLNWVEKISADQKIKSSISLKLAALFHDVDRIVNTENAGGYKGERNTKEYIEHKKMHSKRSSDFIRPELEKITINVEIIERTCYLIEHHDDIVNDNSENNNDEELNCLITADSLSLFTSTIKKMLEEEGEKRVRDKIRFMIRKIPESMDNVLQNYQVEDPAINKIKNEALEEYNKQKK